MTCEDERKKGPRKSHYANPTLFFVMKTNRNGCFSLRDNDKKGNSSLRRLLNTSLFHFGLRYFTNFHKEQTPYLKGSFRRAVVHLSQGQEKSIKPLGHLASLTNPSLDGYWVCFLWHQNFFLNKFPFFSLLLSQPERGKRFNFFTITTRENTTHVFLDAPQSHDNM